MAHTCEPLECRSEIMKKDDEQNIHFDFLGNCPEFIDDIARHWQAEWSSDKETSGFNKQKTGLLKKLNTDRPPFVIVAFSGKKLIGTASLFEQDLDSRPDLTPWLAGVFVLPEYRGRGVASRLIQKVLDEAKNIGFKIVYLHTETTAGLYEKLGWKKVADCYNDQNLRSTIYNIKT